MKKPLSSSACSTITTSNITASADTSRLGCISTLFRRILRRNLHATHPSDYDRNTEFCVSEKAKDSLDETNPSIASGTPNLVAKLMGLDTIPVVNIKHNLSSVTRSRSMNSSETWKEFEETQGRLRRSKSFREIPSFLEVEDEKFFILVFGNGNGSSKFSSTEKRSQKGVTETERLKEGAGEVFGEVKHSNEHRGRSRRKNVYGNNKENLIVLKDKTNVQDQKGTTHSGKDMVVNLLEPLSKKKDSVGGKTRIKKRTENFMAVETNETESDSKNSSPDSVLEDFQLPVTGSPNSPEVSSRLTRSKSRRILWEDLENSKTLTNPERDETLIWSDQKGQESIENVVALSNIVNIDNKIHAEILTESYQLAEEEMLKSTWMLKEGRIEDYEKVGENLEADILDLLIDELVDQLTAF